MASRKLDDELKAAVLSLTPAQKDKILLRLMAKEPLLIKKMTFELLEDGRTTDDRAEKVRAGIEKAIPKSQKGMTPGYLLMYLRSANPLITEHVKVTKDKFGEVALTIYMLNLAFERHMEMLKKMPHRNDTLKDYVERRMAQIYERADKMHEDLRWEFRSDLERLEIFVADYFDI